MSSQIDLAEVAQSICASHNLSLDGCVGGGAFKMVFCVIDVNGERQALKVIRGMASDPRTGREIEALTKCDHPSIARFFLASTHVFEGIEYDYMLEEFLAGGTLTSRLEQCGCLGSDELSALGAALIDAIGHVSELGLVHRDVKPDNIMFREDGLTPVLVDFGIVRDLSATSLTPTWIARGPGTPYFASPEQLNNQKAMIDWRTDQFSLGVVLCLSLADMHPYQQPGEPAFAQTTVDRVAIRGSRNSDVMKKVEESGFPCVDRMTRGWPYERFIQPRSLAEAWNGQGGY